MAKIKLTKTELKRQRDGLRQFERFLPTLQLKKQQLQLEMRNCQAQLDENRQREQELMDNLKPWIQLFGDEQAVTRLTEIVELRRVISEERNIAGVIVPVFSGVDISVSEYNLFAEEPWIDDAVAILEKFLAVRCEREIIEEQHRLLGIELRTTTQRVNLFEKVKIPEARENIRKIQIYLGDMDTAAVGRSKIAKRKVQESAA